MTILSGWMKTGGKMNNLIKIVEQFKNKFTIQKEQIDILNNEVTVHEQWLAKCAQRNPIAPLNSIGELVKSRL